MVIVGRHINGITINPLEYLLDESGESMEFTSEGVAKAFLKDKGLTDDYIDGLIFQTDNNKEID
jgi:hypothetical protein